MLTAMPGTSVYEDSSCLLVFSGRPYQPVRWVLTGSGTLEALTPVTDANGVAIARYQAGTPGEVVTVTVQFAE